MPRLSRPKGVDDSRLALAFYNGRAFGTWLDRVIARHDRGADAGQFSHVELVFEHAPGHASLCFSASYRDGGVRFKRINLEEAPGKWALVRPAIEPADALRLRAWCRRHLGGRYDIPGVLAFKLPWVRHRLNWWFCSEICTAALQHVGVLGGIEPHDTTPNSLFGLITKSAAQPAPQLEPVGT